MMDEFEKRQQLRTQMKIDKQDRVDVKDQMDNWIETESISSMPVSILHYDNKTQISETTIKGKADNRSSPGEKPVAAALHKYGFMNINQIKNNIRRTGHRNLNTAKILSKMQKQGKVRKYTIMHSSGNVANLDVYVLSSDYEQKIRENTPIYKKDMKDIAYIVENMAIGQWHNSLLSEKGCKEILYNGIKCCKSGVVWIPSLIQINRKKHKIYVCGVPVNRNNNLKYLKSFIVNLVLVNRYFVENIDRYQNCLIILIGESISQIEELARVLSTIKATKELALLFTIDMATCSSDPLRNLYSIKRMEGSAEISLIKI